MIDDFFFEDQQQKKIFKDLCRQYKKQFGKAYEVRGRTCCDREINRLRNCLKNNEPQEDIPDDVIF